MSPLHWAAVKGSKASIRHLIEAGADLDAKEDQGKTPRDMAEELKGLAPFVKGMEEAGYSSLGVQQLGRFSEVSKPMRSPVGLVRLIFSSAIRDSYSFYCRLSPFGSSSRSSHNCRFTSVCHSP